MRRAALIWNPVAGAAAGPTLEEALAALDPHVKIVLHETCRERDADACTRDALADGVDLVIAAGGDGTVSAVASQLVGTAVPLAVLPRGTANSFAGALGIPGDLAGAVANLAAGHVRVVDTATAAGRPMVLHCMIGFHADAVAEASRAGKRRWGLLAYLASGVRELMTMQPFDVELETEAHVIRCRAVAVAVANVAPTQTVFAQGPSVVAGDDGLLDVTIVAAETIGEALGAGLHLLRTAAQHVPADRDDIGYFACRRLKVTCTPGQRVVVDGEEIGATPVEVIGQPASLHVLAPPPPPEEVRAHPEVKLSGLPDLEVARK